MTESFDCEGYTKEENKMDEYILKTAAMEIVRRTSGDYAAAFAAIRKLPAADVAPVVRCSQCQHGQFDDLGVMHCHKYHCHKKENDFCSYGEKREDRHD